MAAQIKRATVPCSHWSDPPAPPVCVSSCSALQLLILSCIDICPACQIDTFWQSSTCRLFWVFRLVRVDDVAPEHPDDAHHHLPHHRLPPSHSLLNLCILPPNSSRQVQHCQKKVFHNKISRSRFKSIFASTLAPTSDLPSLHYSILGTALLGEAVPDSGALCAHLGASAKETNVEALFQVQFPI